MTHPILIIDKMIDIRRSRAVVKGVEGGGGKSAGGFGGKLSLVISGRKEGCGGGGEGEEGGNGSYLLAIPMTVDIK